MLYLYISSRKKKSINDNVNNDHFSFKIKKKLLTFCCTTQKLTVLIIVIYVFSKLKKNN